MLSDSNLVAFAATAKPVQAKAFYSDILNLQEVADTPYALVYDVNGTTLRLQKVKSFAAAHHTVLGWDVKNIVDEVQNLTRKSVAFTFYPALTQDQIGIWTTPDGAKVAWFTDPDGNILSITQNAD